MNARMHRSLLLATASVVLAGCSSLSNRGSGSSDNPALPQPSGDYPVAESSSTPPPVSGPVKPSSPAPSAPRYVNSYDDTAAASMTFDNIEITSAGLKDKLNIQRVGSGRTDSDQLSVFAGFNNRTGHVLSIEVQTIYKDKSGNPLTGGRTSWIPMKLQPHEQSDYRSEAISPEAADFLIRVRSAGGN